MQKDTLWWEISAPLVHTIIYWRSRETGANSGVKIILTWHDVLVGIVHWECIFSVRVGGSSGLVMWGRFITGRPEEHREANVAQVCYSCLILPPAVCLSSTAVAVLLRLYLRLICHCAVLTFTTAYTGQTKKASGLTVLQRRTFGGVLAASARQDQSPPLLHANTLMENGQTCYFKETDGATSRCSEESTQRRLNADSTLTPADKEQEWGWEQSRRTKQAFSAWRRQRTSCCLSTHFFFCIYCHTSISHSASAAPPIS